MSREMFKKSVLLLLGGAIAGALLLTLAFMLPVNSAKKSASFETLESEGWYPRASVAAASYETYLNLAYPDVLDGMTDRTMLSTASNVSEGNPFLRAMDSYNEYSGHYSYYWHGYVCILRPLLLLFDYSEIRVLNGICQFLLILSLAFVIGREKGTQYVRHILPSPVSRCYSHELTVFLGFLHSLFRNLGFITEKGVFLGSFTLCVFLSCCGDAYELLRLADISSFYMGNASCLVAYHG